MLDHDLLDAEKAAQNQPLISDLTRYFDTQAEDRASLASIRALLLQKTATTLPVAEPLEEIKVLTPLPIYRGKPTAMKFIKRHPYLNMLVAACLFVLLVGSFALVIGRRGGGAGSPTVITKSSITVVALSPTPWPTPVLPPMDANPGYHIVFQQQGNLANGITNQSTLGQFTTSTVFRINIFCFGSGSVEINLGTWIDLKVPCTSPQNPQYGYTQSVDFETPPNPNTTYHVLGTITGPVQWEVFIEAQN